MSATARSVSLARAASGTATHRAQKAWCSRARSRSATNDFQAKWIDRSGSEHGRLHGHYFDSTAVDGGHFMARWAAEGCSQDGGGGSGSGSGGPSSGGGSGSAI